MLKQSEKVYRLPRSKYLRSSDWLYFSYSWLTKYYPTRTVLWCANISTGNKIEQAQYEPFDQRFHNLNDKAFSKQIHLSLAETDDNNSKLKNNVTEK